MRVSRRHVLRWSGALVAGAGVLAGAARAAPVARIALRALPTGESLEIEHRRDVRHAPAVLAALATLLRDPRSGAQHPIDPALLDQLVELAHVLGVEPRFNVMAGYRDPQSGRAGLHSVGRALDVRLERVDCARLARCASGLRWGGVGYYRAADFVHLDIGEVRAWNG